MTTAPAPASGPAGARPESATMADSAATRAFRERIARVDAQAEEAAARRILCTAYATEKMRSCSAPSATLPFR